jgi:hypothetical protein
VKLETLLGELCIPGRHSAIALLESCLPTTYFPVKKLIEQISDVRLIFSQIFRIENYILHYGHLSKNGEVIEGHQSGLDQIIISVHFFRHPCDIALHRKSKLQSKNK